MKTIVNILITMKKFIRPVQVISRVMLFFILCCTSAWGQSSDIGKKKAFLRVYGHDGAILRKGKVVQSTDSSLIFSSYQVGENYTMDSIHYKRISFIRKGKSPLHYFITRGLLGFILIGGTTSAMEVNSAMTNLSSNLMVSAVTGTPVPPPEPSHAVRNGLIGGIIIGGISAIMHSGNMRKIQIDGSLEKFHLNKQDLLLRDSALD